MTPGYVVKRGGIEVARIAAHHRQALRATVNAPRTVESLAKSCRVSVANLVPVLARLVAVGTLTREGAAYRVTDAGIVDLMCQSVRATLAGFGDGATTLAECQNPALNRQPVAFKSLAQWGLVTRGCGRATITPRGRAVLAVMLAEDEAQAARQHADPAGLHGKTWSADQLGARKVALLASMVRDYEAAHGAGSIGGTR